MISSRSIPATWLRLLAVACGLAVCCAPTARAQSTVTWFASGSTGASGGTGSWDTTNARWTADGSTWSPWNNATNDVAVFAGSAGTVTLTAPITAGGLTFATTGYTVTGGTLTLAGGTPTITTNAGVSATINSGLAGSNGLVKNGAGTLTFNTQKTYTGTTTINAGVLDLTGGSGAGGVIRGTVTVNSGGVLRLSVGDATGFGTGADRLSTINLVGGTMNVNSTSNQTLGNATINMTGGAITMSSGTGNLDFFQGSSTLNSLASSTTSVISGVALSPLRQGSTTFTVAAGTTPSGVDLRIDSLIRTSPSGDPAGARFIKAGAGLMQLTAANTYSGTTVVNAGTLQLGAGGTTGGLPTGFGVTGSAGATLSFNRSNTVQQGVDLNNVIGGAINVSQVGSGTLVLSASNTYTGTTTAAAGTILASGTGNLPGFATSGRVVFNGGIVAARVGGSGWTTGDVDTLLTNATKTGGALGIDTTNGSLTQWTAFTTTNLGPSLGLAKLGSGTLTLNTANTYTGTTSVNGGTLLFTDLAALGTGTFAFGGGVLQSGVSGTLANAVNVAATGTFDTQANTNTLSGAIAGAQGLTKIGVGTLTLSGSNSYAGTTTVSTGTLVASGSNSLPGFGSAGRVVFGGGTLQIPVDGTAWTAAQAGTLLTNATKTSGAIALDVASGSQTLSTAFGGSINFIKLGSGTLQFTGANTYTGTTVVAGGRLLVSNSLRNTAAVTVTSGTAEFGATNVFVGGHGTALAASMVLTADGPGSTLFMNSSMESRIGNVTLSNGGVFTSNRALTSYDVLLADVTTGPATVAVTGTAAATMNGTGGIHLSGTQNFNVADVTGDANTDLTVSLILDAQGTQGGALGGVNKQGAGTMLASGANTYTGNTLVSAGTLKAGSAAAFGAANSAATAVVVSAGATLDVNGQNNSRGVTISGSGVGGLGALVNTGVATSNAAIQNPNIALAADAMIGGTASFYMIASAYGANALTLNNFTLTKSGSNTFFLANTTVSSGTVRISGGTLSQFNTASTGSAAAFVLDNTAGASLDLNSLALSVGSLSGGGGTGGTVSLGSGTITIGALGTSTTYSGSIGGSGALIKIGSGTLTLAGTSGYSGATTISAGVLQLGGGGRLGVSGTYAGAISNAGLLNVASSAAQTLSGVISGTGALVKDGSGTLTLSNGANSFTGDITINSGTLVASAALSGANTAVGARSGSRTITVNPGATMRWTSNDVFIGSGVSASSVPLIVVNSGTVSSTRFNAIGNVTLNSGAVLTQASSDSVNYEGYQFIGTLTVGGSTASTITTTNGKANHLLGGGTTAFNVADVTSSSAVDLTVSSPLRDGSGNYPGVGALLKSGAGTMLLSGTNTYTGGTIVNAGVLDLGGVTAGGTGVIRGTATVNAGAVLSLSTGDATGYNTDASRLSVINLVGGTLAVNTASNQTLGSGTLNLTGGFITGTSTGNIDFFGGASTLNSLASSTTSVISGVRLSPLRQGSTTFTVAAGSTPSGVDLEIQSNMQATSGGGDSAGSQFIKAGAGTLRITGSVTYGGTTAISAGTLQVGGNGTTGSIQNATNVSAGALLAFNRSDATTYSGTISGAGTVSQIGSGTLTLMAANAYTGTTSLAAGVLSLGSAGAIGSTGTISFSGGTLQFTAANTTDYAARIRNSSAAIQLDTNSQTVTFSGAVDSTNGSGLTKLGSGTLTLAAANTYAGNTTISAGVLQLGNGGSVAGNIVNNATLQVNRSDAYTLGNVISGSGALVQAGTGTTTLSVVNSYSGATTVSGGVLSISQDANLGTAPGSATPGSLVISGGALSASAGFEIDARRGIALGPAVGSGTGTIDVAGALTTLTYGGVIADNAGGSDGLAKTGLGTLILAGTSSYSGNTAVNAGTLQVSGSLASPNLTVSGAATLAGTGAVNATTVSAGGILAPGVGGLGTLSLSSVTFSGSGTITMGVQGTAPSTLLNVIGGVTTLGSGSSVAFAFGNSLNSIGTGTYALLSYGGTQLSDVSAFQVTGNQGARQGVNLENGTQSVNLVITNAFPIWSGANSTVWTGSDNWVLSGGGGPTTFLPNDTVVFDDSAATGTVTLTQNVDPATTTFSGTTLAYTLSGGFGITTGALVKSGPATLTISTSNSYSGGTTLSAGTILIGNDAAFGTGDVTVSGTASGITLESDGASPRTLANTLVVQNALTLGDPTNTGALTFTGTVNLGGSPRTLTTLSNATLTGLVTNGGIVKAGAGVLAITGSNAYAAGTTLSAGTLQVGNDAALGAGIVTLADGVTLSANSATARSLANAFTINGNVTLGDAVNSGTLSLGGANGISLGGGSRQVTTPSNVTFAGAVTNGSLVKAGAGTLTLAAANSYSGGTTLSGGVIALGNTAALGSGTLTVAGDSAVRTALTGTIANAVALNSAVTGTFDAQSGTAALSGIVSGAGTLVKAGSGALTLAGPNTLTGTVSLAAGRLNLNTAAALGTGSLVIAGSSTLDNTSGAAVTLTGPNAQAWNADFSFAGTNPLNLGTGAVTLGGNRQVTVTSSTLTVGGGIGGGFALTKAGAGTLSLTGAGNYSGGTTLSAGTLLVGNASALGTGTVALNAGTLFVNGVTAANDVILGGGAIDGAGGGTLSGVLSGGAQLSKTGTGTVALTGPSTFTGGIGINGGVLEASSIADGSPSAIGAGAGSTGFIGIQNATFRYTGATSATSTRSLWVDLGAGTIDVQNAAATLTLNPGGGTRNQNFTKAGAGTLVLGGDITGGAAVTVSAGVLALTASNSYTGGSTVTGGTLQIGAGGAAGSIAGNVSVTSTAGALAFNRSDAYSYSGLISGSGNVRQIGTGTTTLGGANTFSGVLTIAQGAVAVATVNNASTAGALGNSANAVVLGSSNARGTLAYTGVTGTSSKAFTLATGGTGAIDVPTAVTLTLTGGIDGSGGFVKEGAGTLAFSTQKTYTGTTTVNAGVLSLTGGGGAAGTIRGVVNVNPGATFRLAANDVTGYGTGSDRISAINVTSGTLDITTFGGGGQNQTLGNCVITLQGAAITGVSGSATNLDFFQGSSALTTLASSATSTVTDVRLSIRQAGGLTITVADGAADTDLLVASRIYNSGEAPSASLIKAGAGRMTLTALNGIGGGANTNVNAGTLAITGTGQLYDAYAGTAVVTIASGATLELDSFAYGTNGGLGQLRDYGDARLLRGGTISVLGTTQSTGNNFFVANGFSGAFNMTQAGQTLTLSGNNNTNIAVGGPLTFGGAGNITVNEVIENNTGAGSIIKAGLGTLTFGTAMTYTGSTTINAGTFVLTGAGQLGGGNYAGAFTNNAAFVTSATANQTLSGVVSGAGSFTKSGAGTLTLSNAASSFTGGVSLSAGVLSFVSGGLGSSGTVSLGGGTLQWAAGNTSDLSSRLALVNSTTTTLDIGSNNVTLANGIGAGSTASLVKTGGGALTLSASNGFSGGLAVSAGSVLVGNDAALGSGAVSLANGVTLSSADTSARAIANAIAVNGDATLGDATNTGVLTFTGGMNLGAATRTLTTPSNVTIASAVSGAGGLTKAGAGSLTLSASNSYAGDTTINAGTLALSGAGDISASSAALVVIAANAGLDISAASGPRTIGELSGGDATSQVTLGGNTLRSVVSSLAGSFGGVISGSGGFTKAGTAAFELTNLQTFTGPATVEAGRLQLVDGGNLANASRIIVGTEAGSTAILEAYTTLAVVDGQTLGGYGTVTGDLAMLAGGVLSPGGSVGTLANTTGNTTFNGGMRYLFEVNNASGTPGSDPGWDLFTTTGGLALNITGTDQIFVDLTSLAGTSPGEAANFDPTFNYAWKFVVAGSTIGYEYALNPTWFQVTTGAFQNTTNGNFYVARGDQLGAVNVSGGTANELYVVYAAIPEPSTLALAGIGLAAAGWAASRRRRRRTR